MLSTHIGDLNHKISNQIPTKYWLMANYPYSNRYGFYI